MGTACIQQCEHWLVILSFFLSYVLFPTSQQCFPRSLCQWCHLSPVRVLHIIQGPLRSPFSPSCASMCSSLLGSSYSCCEQPSLPPVLPRAYALKCLYPVFQRAELFNILCGKTFYWWVRIYNKLFLYREKEKLFFSLDRRSPSPP